MSSHAPLPRRSMRISRPASGPATTRSQQGWLALRDEKPKRRPIHFPAVRGDAFSSRLNREGFTAPMRGILWFKRFGKEILNRALPVVADLTRARSGEVWMSDR